MPTQPSLNLIPTIQQAIMSLLLTYEPLFGNGLECQFFQNPLFPIGFTLHYVIVTHCFHLPQS